jgi:hypothetical protein
MILGMSIANFTAFHVALSLVGIVSGFLVIIGMLSNRSLPGWTALFLITTIATSVTGFLFPSTAIDPAQVVGIISLLVLGTALIARYTYHLVGIARGAYIIAVLLAQWLNSFVAVVQSFQKIPLVHALAPTQKEPPFLIAQVALMLLMVLLGVVALRKYHPISPATG